VGKITEKNRCYGCDLSEVEWSYMGLQVEDKGVDVEEWIRRHQRNKGESRRKSKDKSLIGMYYHNPISN
jgi:hypothetical protein